MIWVVPHGLINAVVCRSPLLQDSLHVCELNSFERSSEFLCGILVGAMLFSSSHMSFKLFALAIADTVADQQ